MNIIELKEEYKSIEKRISLRQWMMSMAQGSGQSSKSIEYDIEQDNKRLKEIDKEIKEQIAQN